jgi:outer membrane receptor for ferrienterochelin and colicins
MKNVTGVKVRTLCSICNASEIEMQGLPGGYTKILIDGVPIVS